MKIFYRGQHFSLIYNSLEAIIRMKKVATSINSRAQLILMMMNSRTDSFISKELSCTRDRVKRWRTRALELFNKWEYKDTNEKKAIEDILLILSDKYRRGAPSVFTAENICLIVSIALRQPSEFGLPISNWSSEDLAVEVKKQGILELISASTISRILRDASIKPHKSDYWLNPKIEDAAEFAQRVKDICEINEAGKKLLKTDRIHHY